MVKSDPKEAVNIATLKAKLAEYLRAVRAGRELIITDHRQPVARLVPFEETPPLETIKPKGDFALKAKRKIEPLKGIDSLKFLLRERGNR